MRRRRALIATALVVVLIGVLVWWLLRPDAEPEKAADPAPTVPLVKVPAPTVRPVPGPCDDPARHAFPPEAITIDGIADAVAVIGVPRDSRGVTGVLPSSDKYDFAWDLGGIEPGSKHGNVLLNTHTWPDGTALGNKLLADLDEGDQLLVTGEDASLCYEVTERIEVLATEGYPPYYDEDGPPQIAIIVCSGTRTGPGQWTHRTMWFASPRR
ncbi:class F sortase [Nocardioides humilatus]|uniref:Class F sortase n=1 Tax=Nocardioides humilatus TaxID=2607660 RepID=A0A5B1L8J3_9ACTN|nr:class F sortase [Nocardioides humilatus]KAA1417013.1 class F sortase [Nocardioides humilatus]